MAEVQEIDPLEELRLITGAWAEAHGIDSLVFIATRGQDLETQYFKLTHGNNFTQIGLIQKLQEDADRLTQF